MARPDAKDVESVIRILKKLYPLRFFPTNRQRDPYYVLISCLLSLRTKDEVTDKAAERLFSLAKTPEQMARLPDAKISKAIYPVGFYNNKTRTIKEVTRVLIKKHGSKVPSSIDELLDLKGVGRKTAQIVLIHGFGIPAMPVDTHCHRIPNRLGWVKTRTPEETEMALRKIIPERHWLIFNELFVKHGQNTCRPVGPRCYECRIERYCKYMYKNLKP